MVNSKGQYFGDEAMGYSGYTAPVMRQQGTVHAIFDQRILDIAAREPWFRDVLAYGGAKKSIRSEIDGACHRWGYRSA